MIGTLGAAFLGVVGTDLTPVVFTLTLDDLSTRFAEYDGAAASIKFKLTATNGGGALTTSSFVYLDSSQGSGMAANALDAVGDVATLIQTQLNALAGYSGVTANGVATVPGDQWDFTITFPGGLGITALDFHASSQWYSTITLVEAVTQQGVADIAAVAEVVTLSVGGDGSSTVNFYGPGNCSFTVSGGVFDLPAAPTGWTETGGGNGQTTVTYTKDTAGDVYDAYSIGGDLGISIDVQGADAVAGQPEIHTITPQPVSPTGGTWNWATNPGAGSIAWDSDATGDTMEDNLDTYLGNGVAQPSELAGGISAGPVTITWQTNDVVADNILSPVNQTLTAPEITHSIA